MNPAVRNAIARVEVVRDGAVVSRGTASLVRENLALTALHVVADREMLPPRFHPGEIRLTFPTYETKAKVLEAQWDARQDWALLVCDTPPPAGLRPLRLGTVDHDDDRWETYGFPDAQPSDGMVCRGTVENYAGTVDGVMVHQLFCRQAAAGDGMPVRGLSGAPVLIAGVVIGVLRWALLTDSMDLRGRLQRTNVGGTIFACPASLIAAHCRDYFPESLTRVPAALRPTIQLADRALRTRRDFLDDVKSEAAGRLAQSLHTGTLNVLKEKQPEQVNPSWSAEVKTSNQQRTPLTADVGVVQAFDDEVIAGRLLMLGEPGSGKTTALLELSQELINRAEVGDAEPMPVLCHLSSWRDDGQPLANWLVDQLKVKYGVRRDNGNEWLSQRLLVPLLDGLDEVAPEQQEQCVRAINRFQEDHRPKHIVVCCRLAEYENYQTKLRLNGAIRLLPLSDDQIHQYLVHAGCSDVWQSIKADPESVELARSPLLLRIMTVAYEETSDPDWQRLTSASERQVHLFDVYISRMLSNDATSRRYSNARTVSWLAWLATTMKEHGQAEFLIEQLQPTWLQSAGHRLLYRCGVVLNGALALILAISLSEWLRDALPSGALSMAMTEIIIARASENAVLQHRNVLLITFMGVAAGVTLATRKRIQPIETLVWSTTKAWQGMSSGLRKIALAGLNHLSFVGLEIGLLTGVAMLWGLRAADTLSPELTPWSNAGFIAAAVAAVSLAVAVGLTMRPSVWLVGGIATQSGGWAADAILSGLAFGLGAWPQAGLVVGASSGLSIGLIVGFSRGSNTLSPARFAKALVIGFTSGVGIGAITGWIMKLHSGFWVSLWLFGGVGVAATTALFMGLAARLANKGAAVEAPGSGIVGRARRWSEWLVVGGIIAAAAGLILGVVGRSGGFEFVRGVALMTTRLGHGLAQALSVALGFAAAAGALGMVLGGSLGALLGVLNGLTGPDVERRTVPNQGIGQSAVNVGVFALLGGLIVGLPYAVVNVLAGVVWTGVAPDALDWLNLGLGAVVLFALLGGLVPGAACIQHFTLRFVLVCFGLAPLRYARFLNYATERMFLQRIGGRYRFIHDLLRDHFAAMQPTC